MNIIVNSETDEASNWSISNTENEFSDSFSKNIPIKQKGHFRGDSFGDSRPLENILARKELEHNNGN